MQQTRLQCGSIKTVREREMQKSLQAQNTNSERQLLMSPLRRGRGGCCWLLWWLKSWNGLANKLQNVMLSKTRTNGMYSNSCTSSRHQVSKRQEILCWNTYSSFAHFYKKKIKRVWQCDTCDKHLPKFVMRYICMLWSMNISTEVFLVPAYFRQNKSSINIHKC